MPRYIIKEEEVQEFEPMLKVYYPKYGNYWRSSFILYVYSTQYCSIGGMNWHLQ